MASNGAASPIIDRLLNRFKNRHRQTAYIIALIVIVTLGLLTFLVLLQVTGAAASDCRPTAAGASDSIHRQSGNRCGANCKPDHVPGYQSVSQPGCIAGDDLKRRVRYRDVEPYTLDGIEPANGPG